MSSDGYSQWFSAAFTSCSREIGHCDQSRGTVDVPPRTGKFLLINYIIFFCLIIFTKQAHSTIVALKKENEKLEKEANTYYEKFKTHQQRAIRAERCLLKDPIWSGFLMERAIKETEEMKKKRQQDD